MRKSVVVRFALVLCALIVTTASQQASAQTKIPWGDGQSRWRSILSNRPQFYGTDESIRIAENVLLYQNDNGGWPKNIDMADKLSDSRKEKLRRTHNEPETIIDNGATWTQIRFLALVHEATGDQRFADSALRGINYLLEAQYPNGGWPMIYPHRKGYYSHITFNDGAMIGVMNLLSDVAHNKETRNGKQPFDFVDAATRERCQQAIDKGLEILLATQVVAGGKPTVWCAQYDETTLEPAPARAYELVSLSGQESIGIVEYLMDLNHPSPAVKRAIESAVDWFNHSKIEGQRIQWERDSESNEPIDRVVVDDPTADPIWARFYAIGTNRPMFVGRDGIIHDQLSDIERERRTGYAWLGDWPKNMLDQKYPQWQAKWGGE